jgi:hypothetical protein
MKHVIFALEQSNLVAYDGLCRQLAYYNAGDYQAFDVNEMTFNLLSYLETSSNPQLYHLNTNPTTSANANFNVNTNVKLTTSSLNIKLIKSALKIIFEQQNRYAI